MKKKILVLCGGISKERLISLDTGKQVAKELKKNKYTVITCEPDHHLLKNKKDISQPTKIKTSGSTFKNPINQSDKKVWQLIKESVPLNTTFGGACISDKHCNFFVNKNNASFEDMNNLIKFVQESGKKKKGII